MQNDDDHTTAESKASPSALACKKLRAALHCCCDLSQSIVDLLQRQMVHLSVAGQLELGGQGGRHTPVLELRSFCTSETVGADGAQSVT